MVEWSSTKTSLIPELAPLFPYFSYSMQMLSNSYNLNFSMFLVAILAIMHVLFDVFNAIKDEIKVMNITCLMV